PLRPYALCCRVGMVLPFHYACDLTKESLDSLEHFEIRNSDVYIVTFPKSGTVWTQRIVTMLYDDDLPKDVDLVTMKCIPWLEYLAKGNNYNSGPSPRLFCSHLQEHLVPRGLHEKKVIYITRNPKDILVSYPHFSKFLLTLEQHKNMEETLEKFLCGWVGGGSWFDHVKGWYTNHDKYNILFLSYKKMIKDLRSAVMKISDFLGKSLPDAAVDKVVGKATFKNMKSDPKANYEFLSNFALFKLNSVCFFFLNSVSQNERFDKAFEERMKDSPLRFIWDITELH
uniref:Sulfotransferase n=1 Tax=Scleropages formosus TaxID=113540 RepID=A0A8C9R4Z1_SCLFO